MRHPHTARGQFFSAFFLGLVILALPFSIALVRFAGDALLEPEVQESYYPQSADTLTLTIAGRTVPGERPNCFVLLRVDPAAGQVNLCVLPPETMVEDGGRFDVAAAVWHKEGGQRGAAALSAALGYQNDRWLALTADGFRRLCVVIGALDYTLQDPLVLPDGSIAITEGRQLLDGAKLALLMAYGGENERERLSLTGQLLQEGFLQRLPLLDERQLVLAFETTVNVGENDLSVGDFESRRRALTHLISRSPTVTLIPLSGEYNQAQNTFLPSAEMLSEIEKAFSAKPSLG